VPKIDVHSTPAAKSQLPERAHGLYATQRNARTRLNAPMQAMQKHSTQKIPQHAGLDLETSCLAPWSLGQSGYDGLLYKYHLQSYLIRAKQED
jgi:microcystin-dependent protein